MESIEQRLQLLEQKLDGFESDIRLLCTLSRQDEHSALNKIRYITEKVLRMLCIENNISWGEAEPTLERMIGPLIKNGIIPKNISIHVRSIQNYSNPGSHFQEISLSSRHLEIGQMALIEFLEWFFNKTNQNRLDQPNHDSNEQSNEDISKEKLLQSSIYTTLDYVDGNPIFKLNTISYYKETETDKDRPRHSVLFIFIPQTITSEKMKFHFAQFVNQFFFSKLPQLKLDDVFILVSKTPQINDQILSDKRFESIISFRLAEEFEKLNHEITIFNFAREIVWSRNYSIFGQDTDTLIGTIALLLGDERVLTNPVFYFSKYKEQHGKLTLSYDNPIDPNTWHPIPFIKGYCPEFDSRKIMQVFESVLQEIFITSNIISSSMGLNSEGKFEWSFSFSMNIKNLQIKHNNYGNFIMINIYIDPNDEIILNEEKVSQQLSRFIKEIDGEEQTYIYQKKSREDISKDWGSPCDSIKYYFVPTL
ncbi:MAG: hypothetical protein K9N07_09845 [Candidatus Cloacimonetes bacterium]|nr:hypothetical protein [Candidatus Cloacimonadota bacterium]